MLARRALWKRNEVGCSYRDFKVIGAKANLLFVEPFNTAGRFVQSPESGRINEKLGKGRN